MNRFVYGRGWVFCDETNGGDGNGDQGGAAGGTGDAAGGADDAAGADGADDDAGATDGKVDDAAGAAGADEGKPKDMLEAITKGLEKTAAKVDDPAKKAAEEAAAAAKAEKHANGSPKKNAKGEDLDEAGKVVVKQAPKAKTSAELDLKPEEKKLLGAKAQARFTEVIGTLKTREAEVATLTEQMKPLAEARDTMITILEETGTSPDALSAYLEFNRMIGSNDPKELETALGMVEQQREALYKALGREPEGGGLDLLKDFPDLAEDVTEARITRERALELAQARRTQAANDAQKQREQKSQQSVQQVQKARQDALGAITAWTSDLGKKDIDYKAKEEKLLEQVDEVINTYPPNQWLATLKLLYSGIAVPKGATKTGGHQPIRPSGAKPGAKAPQNMFEAMWGSEKTG